MLAFREKFRFRVNLKRRLQVLRASSKKKKPKKKPVDDDDESIDGKKEDDKDKSNLKQKPMFPDEDEKVGQCPFRFFSILLFLLFPSHFLSFSP